jgi:ceramide glucosyltransferase
MWHSALQIICLIGAVASTVYCFIALSCVIAFRPSKDKAQRQPDSMPISLLKPLAGTHRLIAECLASACAQDYAGFEVIFGVADPNDPVIPVVEAVMRDFPNVKTKLVVCRKVLGTNRKVNSLIQMLAHAQHDTIVINDSDILLREDYLTHVAARLKDPSVGMVTCLYSGTPSASLGSRLEAIGINSEFMPAVLCARRIEGGLHFALGSTMAFPRQTLDAIGGFEPLVDYLADDYQLGHRTALSGRRVELADCVVQNVLPDYSFTEFIQHQLRWARTIRANRSSGHAGLILTFAIPWSLLALIVTRGSNSAWALFVGAIALRFATAWMMQKTLLRTRSAWSGVSYLPLRDCLAPMIWIACYLGRGVVWRGNKFKIENGKLRPV